MQDPDFIQQARMLGVELNYRGSKAYTAWAADTYAKEKPSSPAWRANNPVIC
jgi:hypothetical protein